MSLYDICKRDLVFSAAPDDRILIRTPGSRYFNEIRFADFSALIGGGGGSGIIVVRHDASAGTVNFSIPPVSSFAVNTQIVHKRIDDNLDNDVFLIPSLGDTIDGQPSRRLRPRESYTLLSDPPRNNWDII